MDILRGLHVEEETKGLQKECNGRGGMRKDDGMGKIGCIRSSRRRGQRDSHRCVENIRRADKMTETLKYLARVTGIFRHGAVIRALRSRQISFGTTISATFEDHSERASERQVAVGVTYNKRALPSLRIATIHFSVFVVCKPPTLIGTPASFSQHSSSAPPQSIPPLLTYRLPPQCMFHIP